MSYASEEVQKIKELLETVNGRLGKSKHNGTGIVVYRRIASLPVVPLCSGMKLPNGGDVTERIAKCSDPANPCHDGFHLLSESWELTHRNQFFAPFPDEASRKHAATLAIFGARRMAALLGSMLSDVICIGVLSSSAQVTVYKQGVAVD